MTLRLALASVGVTVIVVLTVWLTELSFARAALLAPVLVIGLAAVAGLVVFWGRVGLDSLRRARHPRLVVGLAIAFLLLLVGLALLGVDLPQE